MKMENGQTYVADKRNREHQADGLRLRAETRQAALSSASFGPLRWFVGVGEEATPDDAMALLLRRGMSASGHRVVNAPNEADLLVIMRSGTNEGTTRVGGSLVRGALVTLTFEVRWAIDRTGGYAVGDGAAAARGGALENAHREAAELAATALRDELVAKNRPLLPGPAA